MKVYTIKFIHDVDGVDVPSVVAIYRDKDKAYTHCAILNKAPYLNKYEGYQIEEWETED